MLVNARTAVEGIHADEQDVLAKIAEILYSTDVSCCARDICRGKKLTPNRMALNYRTMDNISKKRENRKKRPSDLLAMGIRTLDIASKTGFRFMASGGLEYKLLDSRYINQGTCEGIRPNTASLYQII